MNWRVACFVALVTWSIYGFFGERAGKIHGEKVNLIFETVAFMVLAVAAAISGMSDFRKITSVSAFNASVMGLLSAGGFWFVLYALKVCAKEETGLVLLLSGMFPIGAAIASNFIAAPLSILQWTGVVMAAGGMILVNMH